ncbi:recombinase family protein [Demequina maris]|uniref:recombinase family protein n=1 Tax=Demequina maris TaxID=1638982 RepID=UPI000784C561|nr:recombinase family protein [Demequina maris]
MEIESTEAGIAAAIYLRISQDRQGKKEGVDRQREDTHALADRLGLHVVEVFEDNDVSASTRSTKVRPAYDEMMRQARLGRFKAILAYSNSRLTRRPREFEDLIDLHDQHGVQIHTPASGSFDLATADGRRMARFIAGEATAESERIGERVARAKAQAVADGKYRGGRRPFGFEKDGVTVRETEARVIREATTAVLAGRTLAAVCRDLNAEGSKTSTGATWNAVTLRDVLMRPRNAGLLSTGRRPNITIVGPAVWDALVEEEQWRALFDLLTTPGRSANQGNSDPKWLGSGIYRCGRCGAPMRSTGVGATPARPNHVRQYHYRCAESAHLTIHAGHTDKYVLQYVANLVNDPQIGAALTAGDGDAMQADRERRALLVKRLAQTERDYDDDLIDARRYRAKTEKLAAELAQVEERLATGVQHAAISPVFNAIDPGATFLAAPIDVQRALLQAVLTVEILPAAGRGKAWTADRLRIDLAATSTPN